MDASAVAPPVDEAPEERANCMGDEVDDGAAEENTDVLEEAPAPRVPDDGSDERTDSAAAVAVMLPPSSWAASCTLTRSRECGRLGRSSSSSSSPLFDICEVALSR
jgi:hypothetical protein